MSSAWTATPVVLALAVCFGAADPPAKPSKDQIAKWVQQLGDDNFTTREEASRSLYEAGEAAEEALQGALSNDDAEIVRRAQAILEKFKWGLYPDSPKAVVELVKRYQGADAAGKLAVVKELIAAGPTGYRTLLKLAGAEPDPGIRGAVFNVLNEELHRAAPRLIAEEKYDVLEKLIGVVLANDPRQGSGHVVAFALLTGKLDDHIARYKGLAGKGADGAHNAEVLAMLLRAKGDLGGARQVAAKNVLPDLENALLFEAGDWKELAKRPTPPPPQPARPGVQPELEALGRRSVYHRLAGDAAAADEDLAALRKMVDASPAEQFRFYLGKVLFLSDRPAEGVQEMAKAPGRSAIAAFEILVAQMKYQEAFDLADRAGPDGAPPAALQILKARTHFLLGDKDKGKAILARYADQIKPGMEFDWFESLIDVENRVGLRDEALRQAAAILAASPNRGWGPRLLGKLFPANADAAAALWDQAIAYRPDPKAAVKLVNELLEGKAEAKEAAEFFKWAEQAEAGLKAAPAEIDRRRRALAEAALKINDDEFARKCLEKAGSAAALTRLGDLAADKKDWDKAAELYQKAWEKDAAGPLPLYLSGWALAKAGKEAEGKKRMDEAHWSPLGDERLRLEFLKALAERGLREAAKREGDLLFKVSAPGSFHAGEGIRRQALEAMAHHDHLKAADGQEKAMLRCLNFFVGYNQPSAFVGVPALIHRLRATKAAADGKAEEAAREAAAALASLPGDTNVPIYLYPELIKTGKKKEADELFEKSLAAQEKVCADYPDCAWAHNSAAWLSVCVGRDLEKAEEHARKAVALTPDVAGCRDTLAEVLLQRGDKDRAVAEQKKAVELDPKRAYFRKQLRRIEAGDPKAPRPDENDEEE
jgi:predicted Zn-dependent protease